MLNKIANTIAENLIRLSGRNTDDEQREVYAYGLECLLNTLITVSILSLWGITTHTLIETIIWLIALFLLRHYAGGYHAPSNFMCIFSSVLLGILNYYIAIILPVGTVSICIYAAMIVFCGLFAPIENHKVTLSKAKQKHYKCISLIILITGFVFQYTIPEQYFRAYTYAFICCILLIIIHILSSKYT